MKERKLSLIFNCPSIEVYERFQSAIGLTSLRPTIQYNTAENVELSLTKKCLARYRVTLHS